MGKVSNTSRTWKAFFVLISTSTVVEDKGYDIGHQHGGHEVRGWNLGGSGESRRKPTVHHYQTQIKLQLNEVHLNYLVIYKLCVARKELNTTQYVSSSKSNGGVHHVMKKP